METLHLNAMPFILPSIHNDSHDNSSIDVIRKNCFGNYDSVACMRSSLLLGISVFTGLLCVHQISRSHARSGCRLTHQSVLLYVILAHLFLGFSEFAYGWTTQASLASSYLRSVELLIIAHYYLTLTCRALRCSPDIAPRIMLILLTFIYLYFTVFVVVALVYAESPWFDCYAPYWLWLSGGHVLMAQIILVCACLMWTRINAISCEETIKRSQKSNLILLTGVFELAAFMELAFHIVLFIMADETIGCSGVFKHRQMVYTPIKLTYELLCYLMPTWVTLYVFSSKKYTQFTDANSSHRYVTDDDGEHVLNPDQYPIARHRDAVRHMYQQQRAYMVQRSYSQPTLSASAPSAITEHLANTRPQVVIVPPVRRHHRLLAPAYRLRNQMRRIYSSPSMSQRLGHGQGLPGDHNEPHVMSPGQLGTIREERSTDRISSSFDDDWMQPPVPMQTDIPAVIVVGESSDDYNDDVPIMAPAQRRR